MRVGGQLRTAVAIAFCGALTAIAAAPRTATATPDADGASAARAAKLIAAKLIAPKLIHFEAAAYPAELLDARLSGTVFLELDIDTAGKVSDAKVVESAGPVFDAAASSAALKLTFSPAVSAGKAVPVRIRFRYRFVPEQMLERRAPAPSRGRYPRRAFAAAPTGFSSLTGRVTERGTGRPVVGAIVKVTDLGVEEITDADGRFRFGLLATGTHVVSVESAEYKTAVSTAAVRTGRTTAVELRAERLSYVIYRATATAPPEPGETARRTLSAQEIQRIPGVYGDAFKVVQNLPGVARVPGIGGDIIVRGSAPGDTLAMIEGVHVPLLYHFLGIYSVINTDILEAIDFHPGGAPVRYGRAMGGLLQARLALPRDGERIRGYVESNVFHTGAFLSVPLSDDTHLTIAGRRSYIDAVMAAVIPDGVLPFTLAPRYYDYQLKLDHRFNRTFSATLLVLGVDDGLKILIDKPPPTFPEANGEFETSIVFHGLIGVLRGQGKGWRTRTTLGALYAPVNIGISNFFRVDADIGELTLRQDVEIGEGPVRLRAGADLYWTPYHGDVVLPSFAASEGQGAEADAQQGVFTYTSGIFAPGFWFDSVLKLSDRLEIVPGLRVDLFRQDGAGESVLPRLNVRYQLDERVTVKGATGLTSQIAGADQLQPRFGNPALVPQKSFEITVGSELKFGGRFTVDVAVFYKRMWDLVVGADGFFPPVPWVNEGTGRVYGLELLIRHEPVGRFFGWIAYTLQRATRQAHPGEAEALFAWDQTHILTALGSYKLPANWEIGARFRLVSGNPYTGVATAIWNENSDGYQRVRSSCINCERLPAFHQLDVRVDKKWVFDRWMLGVYLDVQNVYNYMHPEGINYSFDSKEKAYQTGMPIIPSLGMRGEF